MTNIEFTSSEATFRFPSLASLRAAHSDLLKRFRASGTTSEMIAEMETFIRRGKATGALIDNDSDRWAAQSELDYWATQLYQPGYEPPDATLDDFDPQLAPTLDDSLCPYLGLDAFQEANESVFFGRERLVNELIVKLKTTRFLAVLGSSGSGKSSVVRAGLIPALKKGVLPGSVDWKYLPPMVPGSNPLINLARLMTPLGEDTSRAVIDAKSYRENPAHLARVVSERFSNNVVLVVDQFEEIFTLCTDDVIRNRFVDNLIALCQTSNAKHCVIITMRSDFEMHVSRLPELQSMIDQDVIRITSLTASELRESIDAPAASIGLKFEEGVIDALLNDILGEPAALPLLQFTLLKLWEKRERNRVTWEAYKKLGGGRQALARSADEFYNQLIPEEQVTMRRILLKMVRPGDGLEVTSNRVPLASLYQKAEANDRIKRVLDKLIQARLIRVSEGDRSTDDQVEIAHEALVRNWPRLVEWLEEERVTLRQRQRLTTAAQEWQRLNGASAALWRRELLEEALRYDDLNELETQFVRASNTRQRQGRIAWISGTIATITFLAIAAIIAMQNAAEAKQQAKLALASGLASQAQLMVETRNSKQTTAVLLAVRSMQLSPSVQASQILQNNILASSTASMTHDDWVNEVAFSPDGKYVVSGSDDGTARVWEAATGNEIARMIHDGWVYSVAFSPDGKYVVSGSYDGTARVWEAATGNEIARVTHDSYVYSVAFSPDGQYVLSAGCGQTDNDYNCTKSTARVLDTATATEIADMSHEGDIYDIEFAFSSDGKYVLSAGCDLFDTDGYYCSQGTAHVWETSTGNEIASMTHEGDIYSFVSSPDGKYVVSGSDDGTARVWESATGKEIARMTHDTSVYSVAFSPDGQSVASGSGDGTVRVWETITGNEIARMIHDEWVDVVAFSPDGKYILSAGCDQVDYDYNCIQSTARVWEADTGNEIARMTYDSNVSSVAFSPDGKYVLSAGCDLFDNDRNCTQGTARVWEAATREETAHLTHNGDINSVVFSPDGKYVVSGSEDGTARVWETVTRNEVTRMTHDEWVEVVAFSPDGKYVVSGSNDGTARVWNTFTGEEVANRKHNYGVDKVSFSPDGKYVLSAGCDKFGNDSYCTESTAHIWEAVTGNEIALIAPDSYLNSVAFSPDGKYVISGSDDGTARMWNAASGNEIALMTHESYVVAVAFSPDGKYVVSGSNDGTARVWEAITGKEIARMTHESYVNFVAFSPDGKYVVSAGCDHLDTEGFCTTSTARVWETLTGKEIARMIHEGYVYSVSFSPDSLYVVSRGKNNFVLVWEAATGKEIVRLIHEGYVYSVSFSPDSLYVVSGSDDNTVRVWEIATGKEVARTIHDDWVSSVAFSPDGQYVLSGSGDRTVQVWTWKPSDSISKACSRLTRNFTSAEWKQYMSDAPYQLICPNLPIHPTVIADKILPILLDANNNDRVKIAIKTATDLLEQNAPNGNINELADTLVKDTIRNEISSVAYGFDLDSGKIEPAIILLEDAKLLGVEIDDANELNNICWEGSIYGYARDVLQYCEQAVALALDDAAIRDSRGLARALTGDTAGAIDDFQFFIDSGYDEELGKQRQRWIVDIREGKNPFTPAELETLKEQ
jgi:WD40 repeat protein